MLPFYSITARKNAKEFPGAQWDNTCPHVQGPGFDFPSPKNRRVRFLLISFGSLRNFLAQNSVDEVRRDMMLGIRESKP